MSEGSSPTVGLEMDHRRRFEGQLNKFTNVVKGWQYRWFVLDPESGRLEYHLLEDRNGRCRGSQHLAGAVVLPSEEDSQTFTINFASGEMFKVRASHAKERQMWVDRLRACAHLHNEARASNNMQLSIRDSLPPTPPGSRSHISNGEPSEQLQNLSLSVLDAFGSAHDILRKVDIKHKELVDAIERLPPPKPSDQEEDGSLSDNGGSLTCHSGQMLLLKATSHSTLACMETALALLQEIRESQLVTPVVVHQSVLKNKGGSSINLLPASPSRSSTSRPRSSVRSGPSS